MLICLNCDEFNSAIRKQQRYENETQLRKRISIPTDPNDSWSCPYCKGKVIDVDELIAPVIKLLNNKGYETIDSCSGHITEQYPSGYITFRYNYKELEDLKLDFNKDHMKYDPDTNTLKFTVFVDGLNPLMDRLYNPYEDYSDLLLYYHIMSTMVDLQQFVKHELPVRRGKSRYHLSCRERDRESYRLLISMLRRINVYPDTIKDEIDNRKKNQRGIDRLKDFDTMTLIILYHEWGMMGNGILK